ncbi:MAG: DUF721 domain-containing protein [Planctomycetota bacterium]|nr:DUF721 domain-containing protein [Planctomycetota bacterium]
MREGLPDRYFYNKSEAIRVRNLLKDLLTKRHSTDKNYQKVKNVWQYVANGDVYQGTEVTGLRNGTLYVNVESTTMLHHLTNFEKLTMITRINELVGAGCIRNIRFWTGNTRDDKRR